LQIDKRLVIVFRMSSVTARRCGAVLTCLVALAGLLLAGCRSSGGGGQPASEGTATAAVATPSAPAIPLGRSTVTMTVGDTQRVVHLYRPTGLAASAPLVVMLHGGYGNGVQAENSYHWDPQADRGHFLLALPDGLNNSWNGGGDCCGPSSKNNVDDVAFLTQMVAMLERRASIDTHRIYITGVSNGGVMAYRMACQTTLFAAVAVDSATMLVPCTAAAALSVLHIHGTADPIIPYAGGTGEPYSLLRGSTITTPPIPTVNAEWRAVDHCPAPTTTTQGVVTTSTAQCPGGTTVELITISGAGHQWPGGEPNARAERLFHTGAPSTALDATATIWQFFATHTP
jgi:polyhydroxybutyrate depolymerase